MVEAAASVAVESILKRDKGGSRGTGERCGCRA